MLQFARLVYHGSQLRSRFPKREVPKLRESEFLNFDTLVKECDFVFA